MKTAILISLTVLLSLFVTGEANAQCLSQTLDEALRDLAARWNEAPVLSGATSGGDGVLITGAPDGSTFTVLAILSGGRVCVIASGDGWALSPVVPSGKEG